jgi:hypothetical protein
MENITEQKNKTTFKIPSMSPELAARAQEQVAFSVPRWLWWGWYSFLVLWFIITFFLIITGTVKSGFENDIYDPYGTGIRFLQSRDDTGSSQTNMAERQYHVANKDTKISPLTGGREEPKFYEGYNIDAKIENGKVMLERETFENQQIDPKALEDAMRGG